MPSSTSPTCLAQLAHMTLRERIAQLIVCPLNIAAPRMIQQAAELVEDLRIGGFLVRWGTPARIAGVTNALQRLSGLPLVFATDFERGIRCQTNGGTLLPNQMAIAATEDVRNAFACGAITAREMRAIGTHWLFGPVADLDTHPDNPIVNTRSFGRDPTQVASFVRASVRGLQMYGVIATALQTIRPAELRHLLRPTF